MNWLTGVRCDRSSTPSHIATTSALTSWATGSCSTGAFATVAPSSAAFTSVVERETRRGTASTATPRAGNGQRRHRLRSRCPRSSPASSVPRLAADRRRRRRGVRSEHPANVRRTDQSPRRSACGAPHHSSPIAWRAGMRRARRREHSGGQGEQRRARQRRARAIRRKSKIDDLQALTRQVPIHDARENVGGEQPDRGADDATDEAERAGLDEEHAADVAVGRAEGLQHADLAVDVPESRPASRSRCRARRSRAR